MRALNCYNVLSAATAKYIDTKPTWWSVTPFYCFYFLIHMHATQQAEHKTTQQPLVCWAQILLYPPPLYKGKDVGLKKNGSTLKRKAVREVCCIFQQYNTVWKHLNNRQVTMGKKKKGALLWTAGLTTVQVWPGLFTPCLQSPVSLALFNQSPLTQLIIQINHSWGKWRLPL